MVQRRLNELIKECERLGLELRPAKKKISKRDCVLALRDHFLKEKYPDGKVPKHLQFMLSVPSVMLCYRFKEMKEEFQQTVWDSDEWIAQCLLYSCSVKTPRGNVLVGKLKVGDEVLSCNKLGEIEKSKVTNKVASKRTDDFVRVVLGGGRDSVTCTPNHRIFSSRGLKEAGNLKKGDILYEYEHKMTSQQEDVLIGTLLGDGGIVNIFEKSKKCSLHLGHGIKQKRFLEEKVRLLGLPSSKSNIREYKTNYNTKAVYWKSKTLRGLWKYYKLFYVKVGKRNKKRILLEVLERMKPISWAFWFMDDGSYHIANSKNPNLHLNMHGYSLLEKEMVRNKLRNIGIKNNLAKCGALVMSVEGSRKFSEMISKYVPECMQYKINKEFRGRYEYQDFKGDQGIVESKILDVVRYKTQTKQNVYDITVEPNNNFFTGANILVHNSKINGCRMIIIYSKEEGLHFYSRNISVKDYLPVEYKNIWLPDFNQNTLQTLDIDSFVIDTEIRCPEAVIDTTVRSLVDHPSGGVVTETNLAATTALLSLNDEESLAMQKSKGIKLEFTSFHLLELNGSSFFDMPWKKMHQVLDVLVGKLKSAGLNIVLVETAEGSKKEYFDKIIAEGGEGIVLKHVDSVYKATMSRHHKLWIKVKRTATESVLAAGFGDTIDGFVTGFIKGKDGTGFENLVGALIVSVNLNKIDGSEVVHELARVPNLSLEMRNKITVIEDGKVKLRPEYYNKVAEIDGNWVSSRSLRLVHPRFIRFREDKSLDQCCLDEATLRSLVI